MTVTEVAPAEISPLKASRLTDQVYEAITARILNGTFRPGDRLDVNWLADKLEVSPTPVKNALSLLANEGLVQILPRNGTFVTQVVALLSSAQATTALARRFTPYALGSVLVLGVSGVWMSLEHAGNLWQLPASGYGRTLLLKVGLVGLALGAAVIVRRAFALDRGVRPRLAAEALTLLAVLGVTASLSGQAPPGHTGTEHSGH